jgi:hypothetical protein
MLWWSKTAHFTVAKKQREEGRDQGQETLQGHASSDLLPLSPPGFYNLPK